MKKWIINLVLIFLLISFFIWIIEDKNAEDNIKENYESTTLSTENETIIQEVKQYPKEEIPKTYKGYDVCAKLEIPEISLTTYILSTYSTESLKVSVTKFWGVGPNENGNFCVAGHNYINKKRIYQYKTKNK